MDGIGKRFQYASVNFRWSKCATHGVWRREAESATEDTKRGIAGRRVELVVKVARSELGVVCALDICKGHQRSVDLHSNLAWLDKLTILQALPARPRNSSVHGFAGRLGPPLEEGLRDSAREYAVLPLMHLRSSRDESLSWPAGAVHRWVRRRSEHEVRARNRCDKIE